MGRSSRVGGGRRAPPLKISKPPFMLIETSSNFACSPSKNLIFFICPPPNNNFWFCPTEDMYIEIRLAT